MIHFPYKHTNGLLYNTNYNAVKINLWKITCLLSSGKFN